MTPMQLPRMVDIWDEFIPPEFDFCDSDIVDVADPSGNSGVLELTFDVLPFDKQDRPLKKIRRRLIAQNAYLFDPIRRVFVINQAIKQVNCYPEIVRIDLVTTGSLLRIECTSYRIEDYSAAGHPKKAPAQVA